MNEKWVPMAKKVGEKNPGEQISGLGPMMGLESCVKRTPWKVIFYWGEVYNTSIKRYGELTTCNGTSWNPFEGPGIDINTVDGSEIRRSPPGMYKTL